MKSSAASLFLLLGVTLSAFGMSRTWGTYDSIALASYVIAFVTLIVAWSLVAQKNRNVRKYLPGEAWEKTLWGATVLVAALGVKKSFLLYPEHGQFYQLAFYFSLVIFALLFIVGLPIKSRWKKKSNFQYASLVIIFLTSINLLLVPIISPDPNIDVFVIFNESARGLLEGTNPYRMEFTDIYNGSQKWYPGDKYDFYSYPPFSFVFGLIGYALSDVRFVFGFFHVLSGLLIYFAASRMGLKESERLYLSVLFMLMPKSRYIIEQGWINPALVLGLAAMAFFLAGRKRVRALLSFGWAVAVKQTMLLPVIIFFGFWKNWKPKDFALVFGISLVTYGVFFIWDPRAIVNDLILMHSLTPFRAESLNLTAAVYQWTGWVIPSWVGLVLMFGLSGAFSLFFFRKSNLGSWVQSRRILLFYLAFAITYLATLFVSKHAFANYYYNVHFLLVMSLLWSRAVDQHV